MKHLIVLNSALNIQHFASSIKCFLALPLAMHKHLEHDQNHQKKQESSDIQESIFHTFKQTQKLEENNEANEKLDKDIEVFQRLAQYYYDIDTHADEQKLDNDKLYTILLYQGNEILVPIGVGKYTSEMFTDKHLTDSV